MKNVTQEKPGKQFKQKKLKLKEEQTQAALKCEV